MDEERVTLVATLRRASAELGAMSNLAHAAPSWVTGASGQPVLSRICLYVGPLSTLKEDTTSVRAATKEGQSTFREHSARQNIGAQRAAIQAMFDVRF